MSKIQERARRITGPKKPSSGSAGTEADTTFAIDATNRPDPASLSRGALLTRRDWCYNRASLRLANRPRDEPGGALFNNWQSIGVGAEAWVLGCRFGAARAVAGWGLGVPRQDVLTLTLVRWVVLAAKPEAPTVDAVRSRQGGGQRRVK